MVDSASRLLILISDLSSRTKLLPKVPREQSCCESISLIILYMFEVVYRRQTCVKKLFRERRLMHLMRLFYVTVVTGFLIGYVSRGAVPRACVCVCVCVCEYGVYHRLG